jgi:hypothetical protein
MKQVILNSEYYNIEGSVVRRRLNPRAAQISSGEMTYADFSRVGLMEYHDTRGGIGLESELKDQIARLWWSEGLDTSHEKCLILNPKVTTAGTFAKACIGIFDFGGKTYGYGDNLIAEWNVAGSSWTSRETGLNDPISHCIVTDETNTYAVISSATTSYHSTDGASWTEDSDMKGHLAVLDHRLCGFYGNTLYYSERGNIDGTISSTVFSAYLGTVNGMFQGVLLTTGEPVLYLTTSEGLWAIDFWTKEIYKQEISFPPHDDAGKVGLYWNSYVWIATGAGIKKVTSGLVTDVGPDQDDGLPSGYQGAIYDMEGSSDWLVYCVNGGSSNKSSVLKRHGTLGGNHQIYTTSAANKPIRCVHLSPSSIYSRGRLWWGEDTGIKYCDFPDYNANPLEISGYEFETTADQGKCIYPIYRPLAAVPKAALYLQPLTHNCTDDRYVTLYYKINDAATWTEADDFKSSPLPTAYSFGSGVGTSFYTIQFGAGMTTDSATETPQLESLMFAWRGRPKGVRAWTFTIVADKHDAEDILDDLTTLDDTVTLVTFYPSGNTSKTSYTVEIYDLPEEIDWNKEGTRAYITCTVAEVHRQ